MLFSNLLPANYHPIRYVYFQTVNKITTVIYTKHESLPMQIDFNINNRFLSNICFENCLICWELFFSLDFFPSLLEVFLSSLEIFLLGVKYSSHHLKFVHSIRILRKKLVCCQPNSYAVESWFC